MPDIVYHELTYIDAVLRMVFAMIIGIVVGAERGRNHRPAGMRTHMLVALGSCVVMIVGNLLFAEFSRFGAVPDPATSRCPSHFWCWFSGCGYHFAGRALGKRIDHRRQHLDSCLSGTRCRRRILCDCPNGRRCRLCNPYDI